MEKNTGRIPEKNRENNIKVTRQITALTYSIPCR